MLGEQRITFEDLRACNLFPCKGWSGCYHAVDLLAMTRPYLKKCGDIIWCSDMKRCGDS